MKKLIILSLFTIMSMCNIFAQTANNTVTLTTEQYNKLPIDVKNKIEAEKTVENVGKWAGLGKEIGEGVNSALMAIEGSATRISETNLGKTAMFVVVWKFVGKDFLQIAVGLIVLLIGIPICIRLINSNRSHQVLISKKFIKEKLQFEKTYKQVDGDNEAIAWYLFCLLITIVVSCLIMFV